MPGFYRAHPSERRSSAQAAACGSHIIVVRFYLNEQGVIESGYAQALGREAVGRTFLSAPYAASAGANVEDEPEEAMPNGGIFLVHFEEGVIELAGRVATSGTVTTRCARHAQDELSRILAFGKRRSAPVRGTVLRLRGRERR